MQRARTFRIEGIEERNLLSGVSPTLAQVGSIHAETQVKKTKAPHPVPLAKWEALAQGIERHFSNNDIYSYGYSPWKANLVRQLEQGLRTADVPPDPKSVTFRFFPNVIYDRFQAGAFLAEVF